MLDYISKNKPIARLFKSKLTLEGMADGLSQSAYAKEKAMNGLE